MMGVINVLKPPHMTSHDVVAVLRRILKMKRIGHTGTLDPMAAGVLPICVGRATRIVEYLIEDQKTYRCEMTLGQETDTQDKWGEVIETGETDIDQEKLIEAMNSFIGDIWQIPPMYSALKKDGKKLYELAREGITVEREPRLRTIYDITFLRRDGNKVWFDVTCSKGTYIRTLCHDIGKKLGTCAHMSFLLRTASGVFEMDKTWTVEELMNSTPEEIQKTMMTPVDRSLGERPSAHIPKNLVKMVLNGVKIDLAEYLDQPLEGIVDQVLIYSKKRFLGIGIYDGRLRMDKLFASGDA
jgi:tRNA pseudouridine55 synthase